MGAENDLANQNISICIIREIRISPAGGKPTVDKRKSQTAHYKSFGIHFRDPGGL